MRGHKLLNEEDIRTATELRKQGYTKKQLATLFNVGETTIWENVFQTRQRIRKKRIYFMRYVKKVCIPCERCTICLTEELEKGLPPLNYKVGNICICCHLDELGKRYLDVIEDRDLLKDVL